MKYIYTSEVKITTHTPLVTINILCKYIIIKEIFSILLTANSDYFIIHSNNNSIVSYSLNYLLFTIFQHPLID